MAEMQLDLKEVFPLPSKPEPREGWGRNFGGDSGFSLRLPKDYSMSVFLDRRIAEKDYAKRADYFRTDQVLARMLTCVGEEWELHTEPIGRDEVGVVIYTHKGKALAAGSGQLQKDGTFRFTVKTLYKGITDGTRTKYEYECEVKMNRVELQ